MSDSLHRSTKGNGVCVGEFAGCGGQRFAIWLQGASPLQADGAGVGVATLGVPG